MQRRVLGLLFALTVLPVNSTMAQTPEGGSAPDDSAPMVDSIDDARLGEAMEQLRLQLEAADDPFESSLNTNLIPDLVYEADDPAGAYGQLEIYDCQGEAFSWGTCQILTEDVDVENVLNQRLNEVASCVGEAIDWQDQSMVFRVAPGQWRLYDPFQLLGERRRVHSLQSCFESTLAELASSPSLEGEVELIYEFYGGNAYR